MFPSSKEVFLHNFRQFLENLNFWRKFDRRGPYKNSENLVLSQIVLRKYFLAKLFVPFHQKKCFSTILGTFWKFEFLTEFDRRGPYKNSENLVLSQIVLKKIFFGKIICSFHQKKCFSTILGTFWKFEFLTEFDRRGTLQK